MIFYEVEITSKQEKTILDKRYSDFERLHKDLKKIFENLPSFPSKTIFKISNNPEELMKRRDMLDNYIIVRAIFEFFLFILLHFLGNYQTTGNFKLGALEELPLCNLAINYLSKIKLES